MTDIPELTAAQFERAMPASVRRRLLASHIESGADIVALRNFLGLTQERFASAVGISVHTLRNWEQGRRRPDGPAVALLRIAPGIRGSSLGLCVPRRSSPCRRRRCPRALADRTSVSPCHRMSTPRANLLNFAIAPIDQGRR